MLPHESKSPSSSSSSSFLPSSSSCAEITEPEAVIKVEDEIQSNSAGEVESEVKVKVEDQLDKEKEENVFQHLSKLLNEPDDDRTNKNGTILGLQNVEFDLKEEEKEEEDVWMDESDQNIPIVNRNPSASNSTLTETEILPQVNNKRKNSFIAHRRTHKSIKSPLTKKITFSCNLCSVTTSRKDNLERHIQNVHERKRLFKCSESGCGYLTNKKFSLKCHGFSRHGKRDDLEILNCSRCPFKTPDKTHLRQHVNSVHARIFPFACDLCPFKTCTKQNLQRHVNCVHLNLRPYKCPQTGCDYAAKECAAIKSHVRASHKKSTQEIKNIWKSVSSKYSSAAVQIQPESTSQLELKLSTKAKATSKIPICSENVQPNSKSKVKSCEIVTAILFECKNCEFYTKQQKQLATHLYNQHNLPKVQLQLWN